MNNKPYKTTFKNLKEMSLHVGKELGLTDWVEIKQSDINTFAKLTEDEQWIHIDKEKSETLVEKLSGGEKTRLLFCIMSYHSPDLLLLDEPTNHLDIDSRISLINSLNAFEWK